MNVKTQIVLALVLFGCYGSKAQYSLTQKLKYDHLVLFVNDSEIRDSLNQIFTPAKKLTTSHKNQGTKGYYYLFYNTFIELLYLEDSLRADDNTQNFGSNYITRWQNASDISPIGFGVNVEPWDTHQSKVVFKPYYSLDAQNEEFYLMSRFNSYSSQPLIYASMPQRAYEQITSLTDLKRIANPEVRNDFKKYLQHPCGVKQVKKVTYTSPIPLNGANNLALILYMKGIDIEHGEKEKITLEFENRNGKSMSFPINDYTELEILY